MRDLIITITAVTILILAWMLFFNYSEQQIDNFTQEIESSIIPLVEAENWSDSIHQISLLSDSWHQYKKIALLFLDTDSINEIDYSMAKSEKYIQAQDVSNASGELSAMYEQFTFLSSNDKINLANIL